MGTASGARGDQARVRAARRERGWPSGSPAAPPRARPAAEKTGRLSAAGQHRLLQAPGDGRGGRGHHAQGLVRPAPHLEGGLVQGKGFLEQLTPAHRRAGTRWTSWGGSRRSARSSSAPASPCCSTTTSSATSSTSSASDAKEAGPWSASNSKIYSLLYARRQPDRLLLQPRPVPPGWGGRATGGLEQGPGLGRLPGRHAPPDQEKGRHHHPDRDDPLRRNPSPPCSSSPTAGGSRTTGRRSPAATPSCCRRSERWSEPCPPGTGRRWPAPASTSARPTPSRPSSPAGRPCTPSPAAPPTRRASSPRRAWTGASPPARR